MGPAAKATLIVTAGMVMAQLAIFAKSRVGLSVYSNRYLMPLILALVLLLGLLLTGALGSALLSRIARPVPAFLLSVVVLGLRFARGLQSHDYDLLYAELNYPQHMQKFLPPGSEVVVTFLPTFMLLRMLDPVHHYTFTTDWEADGKIVGKDLSGERLAENIDRAGYTHDEVLDLPQLVQQRREFTLLAKPSRRDWVKNRFERDGAFDVQAIGTQPEWYPMTGWKIRCLRAEGCHLRWIPDNVFESAHSL